MHQKCLLNAKKKVYPKVKKAENNKEASNDKNEGNVKDAGFFVLVTASLSFPAPIATSPNLSTPSSVTLYLTSATGVFIPICPSLFSFSVWLSLFSFPAHYTTLTSPFLPRAFRFTLLLLKHDYTVHNPISPLVISRK